jgi:D-3-phosphoglycerate dehydrogenase / 2-oxoglutarate reductase
MRVLIADQFQTWGVEAMTNAGCEVTCDPALHGDALRDAIAATRCNALVVRSTKVSADAIEAGTDLALIVRAGAGYNTIDVAAASRRAILVANCPGKNAVAVAELAFALMLALDRRIVDNAVDLRKGTWNKKGYGKSRGLKGRTLGIIGMGKIGQAVAKRAQAFDMPVVAWSRSLTDEAAEQYGVERCIDVKAVAERSDILSIHVAATPDTRGLVSADVLKRLKPGSYVINTSRADVLDYDALKVMVNEHQLRVGLDVYPNEPSSGTGQFSPEILNCDGVIYGTHHIGASTDQAQNAIAAETVRVIKGFAETGLAANCVNLRGRPESTWRLTVRHLNQPGVLAHVLGELSKAKINVEEMENVISEGAKAACAHIHLDAQPSEETIGRISGDGNTILSVNLGHPAE